MARFTPDDLARITARPHYAVQDNAVAPRLPDPIPQHDAWAESVDSDEDEKGGSGRSIVRITRFGTRLLDVDNLVGGTKWAVDALRYAKLIPEDNPQAIKLIVSQKKVKKAEVGTLIEIEYI